jgi:hypothetical protein
MIRMHDSIETSEIPSKVFEKHPKPILLHFSISNPHHSFKLYIAREEI